MRPAVSVRTVWVLLKTLFVLRWVRLRVWCGSELKIEAGEFKIKGLVRGCGSQVYFDMGAGVGPL